MKLGAAWQPCAGVGSGCLQDILAKVTRRDPEQKGKSILDVCVLHHTCNALVQVHCGMWHHKPDDSLGAA